MEWSACIKALYSPSDVDTWLDILPFFLLALCVIIRIFFSLPVPGA